MGEGGGGAIKTIYLKNNTWPVLISPVRKASHFPFVFSSANSYFRSTNCSLFLKREIWGTPYREQCLMKTELGYYHASQRTHRRSKNLLFFCMCTMCKEEQRMFSGRVGLRVMSTSSARQPITREVDFDFFFNFRGAPG